MNPIAPRPTSQIERDLNALRYQSRPVIPDLSAMNVRLARLTAEAMADQGNGEKQMAVHDQLTAIHEAEQAIAAIGQRNTAVRALEVELDLAQQFERSQRIAQANDRLAEAKRDYLTVGKQLIDSYRRLLVAQRQSQQVPGASTAIPRGFHFEEAFPMGWQGNCAEFMQTGYLPCERKNEAENVIQLDNIGRAAA